MTYINAVKYLIALGSDGGEFTDSSILERMRLVCDNFDISLRNLKCIHVCGDENKKSSSMMLSAILEEASYKVGHYFLPANDDFKSCIICDKKSISHLDFAEIITSIYKFYRANFKDVIPHRNEILTLAAIIYFQRQNCDIAIFEKGYSRNDPVNITDAPVLSLITPISDRNTDRSIFENIIHKGTIETVSSPQHKEIYNAISSACSLAGSRLTIPIYSEMEIERISLLKTFFKYRRISYSVRSFSPARTLSAITAIEGANALTRVGADISSESIVRGISNAVFEEKCETVSHSPTVILFSCEKDKLSSFLASIAQVKDQLCPNINVYVDEELELDNDELSEALSVRGIAPQSILSLPNKAVVRKDIKGIISDLRAQYEFDFTAIFIGSGSFISEIKGCIHDCLGN